MTPDALATIHAASFTTPRPWRHDEFETFLKTKGVKLYAHEHGFLLSRIIANEAEILTLAVEPNARRQNIATALVNQLIEDCRAEGVCEIFLEVAATNTAAIALYAHNGFAQTGNRPAYYTTPDGTKIDALLFARTLQR